MSTETETKHTAEPWAVFHGTRVGRSDGAVVDVCDTWKLHRDYVESAANAARIVACVNKCAGIQDLSSTVLLPADTLAKVREFLSELAKQKPEKPDYWSSCGQCDRNTSEAEDILSLLAAAQKQGEG